MILLQNLFFPMPIFVIILQNLFYKVGCIIWLKVRESIKIQHPVFVYLILIVHCGWKMDINGEPSESRLIFTSSALNKAFNTNKCKTKFDPSALKNQIWWFDSSALDMDASINPSTSRFHMYFRVHWILIIHLNLGFICDTNALSMDMDTYY